MFLNERASIFNKWTAKLMITQRSPFAYLGKFLIKKQIILSHCSAHAW